MILKNCTINFRYFLHVFASAVRLHQSVGIFYDITHFDRIEAYKVRYKILHDLKVFYNITIFTDFVPGFLTNPGSSSLFTRRPRFALVIFLNFDPFSSRQVGLLNEIQVNKMEYILISGHELDINRYAPYLYLNVDLNDLSLLKVVKFYLFQYTLLFVKPGLHNLKGNQLASKIFNFNCLYLSSLFQDKLLWKEHLKLHVRRSDLRTFRSFVGALLKPSIYKTRFFDKYMECLDEISEDEEDEKLLRKSCITNLHAEYTNLFQKFKHKIKNGRR